MQRKNWAIFFYPDNSFYIYISQQSPFWVNWTYTLIFASNIIYLFIFLCIKYIRWDIKKSNVFNVNSNFIQFVSYCMNVAYFIYTSREINLVFEIRNCSIINGKTLNLYKLFKLFGIFIPRWKHTNHIFEKQWQNNFIYLSLLYLQPASYISAYDYNAYSKITYQSLQNSGLLIQIKLKPSRCIYMLIHYTTVHFS